MKVCYFGSYNPTYPRNRIIIKGLRRAGADVAECRAPTLMPKKRFGPLSLPSVCLRFLPRGRQLKTSHDSLGKYDAMIMGYPGDWANYFTIPLGKILSGRRRAPLFLDQFISLYESYVYDKKMLKEHSPPALACEAIDRTSCRLANVTFLDTRAHISLFARRLGLDTGNFRRVFVGTDEDVFFPRENRKETPDLNVLFYGTMIPLQGVDFIVQAAALLKEESLKFTMVGPEASPRFIQARNLAGQLGADNMTFHGAVPYETLPDLISRADVCLGIFGTTEKARAVIPNKAFEAIAMAKPLITGDSPAAREVFQSRVNALLCPMGSPQALADAIRTLMEDNTLRRGIADAGYQLFTEGFTTKNIGLQVLRCIREVLDA
ncbi:MAG: glycosyltransferase [bacterium]